MKALMKLYIGNLSYETTESVLREILAEFEPITDVFLPMDRETGRPRGFAFVTFTNFESGEAAIAALDGREVNGRKLRVNEAEDRGGGGGPPRRAPMENPMDFTTKRRDDRPTDADGKKVRYKGI
jgi:cold-inducible RNA-binding protein